MVILNLLKISIDLILILYFSETGEGACKNEESASSLNSFVTEDIQRHIDDAKSPISAVNEECLSDNEDDLNLQEIFAEELSMALYVNMCDIVHKIKTVIIVPLCIKVGAPVLVYTSFMDPFLCFQ